MTIKTNIKAGGMRTNHSQTGMTVKSGVKSGGMRSNHNQSVFSR